MGVALTSLDGQFLAANQALLDMLRTTETELLQRKVIDVYVDSRQREVLLDQLYESGTLRDFSLHLLRDDGSSFYARLNSSLLQIEGREVALAMVDDVTDQIVVEQEAAVLEERERLARELHDAVTQTLFSASVLAQAAPRLLDKNPAVARQNMEQLALLIRGALAEMRTLLFELRPGEFTQQNLSPLFDLLAESTRARTRANVSMDVQTSCSPPEEVAIAYYRIAQESLNNIAKHSLAGEIVVDLTCTPEGATLTIEDDGRGFDPQTIPAGHMGVSIMRERAQMIGAIIEIDSEIGGGTQVTVSWTAAKNESEHE
jgi:two-component system nitrate/nitrite sensor histidine kinase NarX